MNLFPLVTNTRYIEVIAVIDYVSSSSTFRIRNGFYIYINLVETQL